MTEARAPCVFNIDVQGRGDGARSAGPSPFALSGRLRFRSDMRDGLWPSSVSLIPTLVIIQTKCLRKRGESEQAVSHERSQTDKCSGRIELSGGCCQRRCRACVQVCPPSCGLPASYLLLSFVNMSYLYFRWTCAPSSVPVLPYFPSFLTFWRCVAGVRGFRTTAAAYSVSLALPSCHCIVLCHLRTFCSPGRAPVRRAEG